MNLAHLHLIINHVPTVGSVVALGLLLLGYVRRNEHLKHVGLEVLFVIAVLTLPVYVSGVAAHQEVRPFKEVSDDAIRVHQDAALIGFTVMEFAGFVAWLALWQWRRHGRAARGLVPAATVLLVLALVVMGRAANLGGEIRHPEILAGGVAAPAGNPERFMTWTINQVAVYSRWAWPAAETVHFLGLSLSFGVLLAVNLRILGVMSQMPFADVHRLLPWGMLGFGANLITGMFFFVGQPGQYSSSEPFKWKVVFLVIAGANFLYLTVWGRPWGSRADDRFDAGLGDKAMAILSLSSWVAVLWAGRMLPFLGKAF
ncbi:MAG TPA: hypothetical protein VKB50_02200 [Vicinamibacterales bacterium]|nr:hypothetical protein [Vicinamibacterales bacterium]